MSAVLDLTTRGRPGDPCLAVVPPDDLGPRINAEHRLAIERAADALSHARITGDLLLLARASVPAGGWQGWIARECPDISTRTVRRYMQLAREWPRVAAATTVRAALAALAPARPESNSVPVGELVQPPTSVTERLSLPLPEEMRVTVEPGHMMLGVLDGEPVLMISESQRHRGYWYVFDQTTLYSHRPIRADAVGILTAQHPRWRDMEWHMTEQVEWFPEAA